MLNFRSAIANALPEREIFTFATVAALSASVAGLVGSFTNIGNLRFSDGELAAIEPMRSTDSDCDWRAPLSQFPKIETCRFGAQDGGAPIILWGDFHADALLAAADESFKASDIAGWRVRNRYCRPIVGIYDSDNFSVEKFETCEKSQAAVLNYLHNLKPRAIVISIRWTFQLFPIEGKIEELGFNNGEGGQEQESYRTFAVPNSSGHLVTAADPKAKVIQKFIESFTSIGVPVLIQYPVPEVGWSVPNLNFKRLVSTGAILSEVSTSLRRYDERNAFVTEVLDSVIKSPSILAIKVSEILCNSYVADRCAAQVRGIPLYFDDEHLSKEGAKLVVAKILSEI